MSGEQRQVTSREAGKGRQQAGVACRACSAKQATGCKMQSPLRTWAATCVNNEWPKLLMEVARSPAGWL